MVQLRSCNVQNQDPLQASKWSQVQVLLDTQEMDQLLKSLGEFWIFISGSLLPKNTEDVSPSTFLETYDHYVSSIKAGQPPDEDAYRKLFSSVFTCSLDAVYALQTADDQIVIRPRLPVVQLQLHRLGFSHVDHKFRSMVFGRDSISWGIQFSYPQLYQDAATKQIMNVDKTATFPNTEMFRTLQRWIRHHTLPTPFLVEDKRVNVPVRLGKEAFQWINRHPQLAHHGLAVKQFI